MKIINLLFLVFICNFGWSQTSIIDTNFVTGFFSNELYNSSAEGLDQWDSLTLYITVKTKQNGNRLQYLNRYFIDKSNLNVKIVDTVYDYSKDGSLYRNFRGQDYLPVCEIIEDKKNNTIYYLNALPLLIDSSIHINLYAIKPNGKRDSLVFSVPLKEKAIFSAPYIYDSVLYITSYNLQEDTLFLDAVDFNGIVIQSSSFADNSIFPNYVFNTGFIGIFPQNDSFLMVGSSRFIDLVFINRHSLQVDRFNSLSQPQSIQLTNQYQWGNKFNNQYILHPNHYTVFGSIIQTPFMQNFDFTVDRGGYSVDFDYNGSILTAKEFGNDTIHEEILDNFLDNDTNYYTGVSSYDITSSYALDYRDLIIFIQYSNHQDSILLYGNKNHIGRFIHKDQTNDLFILSQYSNAWTNDSVFVVLTKIPSNYFTGLKKIKSKTTSLIVYPNPTSDYLKSNSFKRGETFQIYDLRGVQVSSGRIKENGQLNVSHLRKGSYFIKLIGEKGISQRATLFVVQ